MNDSEHPQSAIRNSKALFLDRDGTLIYDKHYLADPAGVELIPGVTAALRRARSLGYQLFLFTNQSGVARGLHTLDDVLRCNTRMEELLGLPLPLFTDISSPSNRPKSPTATANPLRASSSRASRATASTPPSAG